MKQRKEKGTKKDLVLYRLETAKNETAEELIEIVEKYVHERIEDME